MFFCRKTTGSFYESDQRSNLYCMWQTSAKDEDAEDTWVAYARSTDGGTTWSEPMGVP